MTQFTDKNLAIVIPAMNEAPSVGKVVTELREKTDLMVIVIDDASTDATAQLASEAGAVVLSLASNLGAWRATQTGIRYALSQGIDAVITCDADGQHPVTAILDVLAYPRQAEQCLVGACPARASGMRRLAWHLFNQITRLHIHDLTSGLRLYSKRAMTLLATPAASLFEYQDVGVLLLLRRQGITITEVPVNMQQRQNGMSRIFSSWLTVVKYMLYTLTLSITKLGKSKGM